MIMTQRISKLVLTSHITFSIGWLGAVAVFLALAITGLNSQNPQLVRACLLAMKISAWFVIVPFCLTALATGVVQAAWTKWGIFRHYWIVVKLFLTLGSTLLLLLHLQPINELATAASQPAFTNTEHSSHIIDLIGKSGAAILVLLFITTISIYKPWGKIQVKEGAAKSW
ncbi:MAG: hypothetical protein EOO68_34310, partial [Moraxellaceae bacterium]